MPINELERHPFLNYLYENVENKTSYNGLIIGSFPVFSCTDSLDNNLNVAIERFVPKDVHMRFFYGSRKSNFWEYVSSAFGEVNPIILQPTDNIENPHLIARQRTISFLQRNKLLITDSIFQTNRNMENDEDSNLWVTNNADEFIVKNLSLNTSIIDLIDEHNTIENLYFTATGLNKKSPFGWFREIFGNNITIQNANTIDGRRWSFLCSIKKRKFNVFMLPTPKPRGIHFTDNSKTQMFVNYLQHNMTNFYLEIENIPIAERTVLQEQTLKSARKSFIIECYNQAFVTHNLEFSGQVT